MWAPKFERHTVSDVGKNKSQLKIWDPAVHLVNLVESVQEVWIAAQKAGGELCSDRVTVR
jgi:hypothetical protein